jgi:hypothetical protein
MIGMSGMVLLFSVIAVLVVSGCTQIDTGNGVKVLEFGPDLSRAYPGEVIDFRVRFQNTGSLDAEGVFAELLGLDEDWYNPGFSGAGAGGPWEDGEKLPNEEECRYTDTGSHKTLLAPNPQYGTPGEKQTCSWTYKAPGEDKIPRDMDRVYPVTARVFYDYRTDVVKLLPLLSKDEVLKLRDRGGTIEFGDVSSTSSPVRITLQSESPIRVIGDGSNMESVEFPIKIDIEDVGGGTPCLPNQCKKTEGGEWNKILLKITTGPGVEFRECGDDLMKDTVISLYKGQTNSIQCFVKISGIQESISQDTLVISATYSYFVDADSEITVGR